MSETAQPTALGTEITSITDFSGPMAMLLNVCSIEHELQFVSAGFAGLAAWRWLAASLVKVPDQMTWETIDHVYPIIARQSRLNAQAAFFAGLAALLQLPQAFMPSCLG